MDLQLTDKIVVVTGAASGIGQATARLLTEEGAIVVGVDRDPINNGLGACDTAAPIVPTTALAGEFTWNCERGRVRGQILLAPTPTPQIQSLTFARSTP